MSNEAGTGELLAIPLFGFVCSLFVFWVIRSKLKLSMIQNYRNTITESSANGKINILVLLVLFLFIALCIASSMSRNVSI